MIERALITRRFTTAIAVLAGLGIAIGFAAPAHAAGLERAVLDCRLFKERDARLNCYDAMKVEAAAASAIAPVLPQTPASTPALASTSTPTPTPTPTPAPMQSQAQIPAPAPVPQPAAPGVLPSSHALVEGELSKVGVQIAGVSVVDENMLRIVTTDGFIWDQVEKKRIRTWPKVGDTVLIKKALVSGYQCRLNDRDLYHCSPPRDRAR